MVQSIRRACSARETCLNYLTAPIQRSQASTSPSSSYSPRPLPRHLVRFRGCDQLLERFWRERAVREDELREIGWREPVSALL